MFTTSPVLAPLRQVFGQTDLGDRILGGLVDQHEAPFWVMIEDLTDPLLVLDPKGIILYANAAWRSLRDTPLADAVGRDIAEFSATNARTALEILEGLTEENRTASVEFQVGDQHMEVVYNGYFDRDGVLVAVTGIGRDRTDHYFYEEELWAANNALAESNRDLQDFAHIASHDLQEPLRKISAFSERLGDKYADSLDERGQDYLERISSASGRMQQLIRSLLDYSRVNSRGGDIVEVDLDEVANSVLSDLEVAFEQAEAVICLGDLPTVRCDQTQMRQLFQNLIGNALKFRREGVVPRLSVHAETDDAGHTLTFADNGIGFEQEFADTIFAPFQRLHARTEYAGSGIGLSVCRRIVERIGGSIYATSAPGEGATFTVTLPFTKPSAGFGSGKDQPAL